MKKLLSLILAGSMLFSFAACGENEKDGSEDKAVENISEAEVGSYIVFGSYEQDNDTSNGKEPIEWLVLDKQDGKILVISKYALDCKPYNTNLMEATWETCTLRSWLNDEFVNNVFTSNERDSIATATVTAKDNYEFYTDAGNDTQDNMFLLSMDEVVKYFGSDNEKRKCEATEYAENNGAAYNDEEICWWWLRSPGYVKSRASYISCNGLIDDAGDDVNRENIAVRPAMWIEL